MANRPSRSRLQGSTLHFRILSPKETVTRLGRSSRPIHDPKQSISHDNDYPQDLVFKNQIETLGLHARGAGMSPPQDFALAVTFMCSVSGFVDLGYAGFLAFRRPPPISCVKSCLLQEASNLPISCGQVLFAATKGIMSWKVPLRLKLLHT